MVTSFCSSYKSKPVAVKMIQPSNPSAVIREHKEKFQREVLLLSRMDHENVVKVFKNLLFTSFSVCLILPFYLFTFTLFHFELPTASNV